MEILKIIADNQNLSEALKKVLLAQFEPSRELNLGHTDEVLGQFTRANLVGKRAVEEAFKEINKYKTVEPRPAVINRAR